MDLKELAKRITARTMRGIALDVANLIRSGTIPIGTQLPPVRDLADVLEVSPATVSGAWKQLRTYRMISGSGRTGTWVRGDQTSLRPARFEGFANYGENVVADLRFASPDPLLMPDLEVALVDASKVANLNSYTREAISSTLKDVVASSWPYADCTLTAANGGYDALYSTLQTIVVPGATVAIEDPTALRVFDILEKLGAEIVGVACDEQGPLPASLAAAMQKKPLVFLYQPGVHVLTGHCVSGERMRELGSVLENMEAMIVELDFLAEITIHRASSLGATFGQRTVHIRNYSASLGPDLGLAVMSSSEKFADQVQAYRNFREGWTSRLLQGAAANLLSMPDSLRAIEQARETYAARRVALVDALAEREIKVRGAETLCIWLAVPDEQYALISLAARSIAVQPGSFFQVNRRPYIRIATSLLTGGVEFIADGIAACIQQD
jgi:DNA-binding transcriptional MocR family regulator